MEGSKTAEAERVGLSHPTRGGENVFMMFKVCSVKYAEKSIVGAR